MNRHDLLNAENEILQLIQRKEICAGDTIPSVRKLQEYLIMSRNTVLTAVQSLSTKGILRKASSSRGGYILARSAEIEPSNREMIEQVKIQYLLPFSTWNYTINKYLAGFESVFSHAGINIFFRNTHNSAAEELRLINEIMDKPVNDRPDFVFFTTCNSYDNPCVNALLELKQIVPVLLIDRSFPFYPFHCISVNNLYIGCQTAQYLMQKGHRNIAYIKAYNAISTIQDRFCAFQNALLSAGIALPQELIFTLPGENVGTPSDIQNEVDSIGSQIIRQKHRPTAVVCSFDRIAVALVNYFRKNSIRVPEDISVVGCDNDLDVGAISPLSITTFKHPYKDCALEALAYVKRIKSGHTIPLKSTELFSTFIEGEST